MLQKSKSKTIAKFKFLVLLPLMLLMFTVVSCSQESTEQPESKDSLSEQLDKIKLKIEDKDGITPEELQKLEELFLFVLKKREMKAIEKSKNASGADGFSVTKVYKQVKDVPFAVIDQVPVFPGCENLGSNDEKKECMSRKIQEFVNKNFNTGLGKELNLTGVNRVIVQFKIDKNGNITDVRSRAPHPDLEVEAERVINSLPSMKPGKQGGMDVGVMYSLPIVFQVGE